MLNIYSMVKKLEQKRAIERSYFPLSNNRSSFPVRSIKEKNSGEISGSKTGSSFCSSLREEDKKNKIEIQMLPPESSERYLIKVNSDKKEILRGSRHETFMRELELDTRLKISDFISNLSKLNDEFDFVEHLSDNNYMWIFKELPDFNFLNEKEAKKYEPLKLSFKTFGTYWILEDIDSLKLLESGVSKDTKIIESSFESFQENYLFHSKEKDWAIEVERCVLKRIDYDDQGSS